jgi:prolyl 4-hydroxylase
MIALYFYFKPREITETGRCFNITLYRHGQYYNLSDVCNATLLPVAQTMFPSRHWPVTRFLTMTGEESAAATASLMALGSRERERFVWPFVARGHAVDIAVGPDQRAVTLVSLSDSPRVFEVRNLLSDEECDLLYQTSLGKEIRTSTVAQATRASAHVSAVRSSRHTWLNTTDLVLERRVLDLVRVPLNEQLDEPFQIVHYNISGFYHGHHDYAVPDEFPDNTYLKAGGNRFLTVLCYLNDVEEGGETVFPFVDTEGRPFQRRGDPNHLRESALPCQCANCLKVKPRKGSAILFYNLAEKGHMDGAYDKWSLHAGCPPITGPKHIVNKWVRNKRVGGKLFGKTF